MAPKHAVKHARRDATIKLVAVVGVAAAVAVLIGFAVSRHLSSKDEVLDDKPIIEVLQDDSSSDASEAEDSRLIANWIESLNDEQKAELDIAYEASVADGYTGTMDEWIATEVQAHTTKAGDVVVVLPDGGEFTIEKAPASQDDKDQDTGTVDASDTEGQPSDEQEGQPSDPPEQGAGSALLSVDTVVAHQGDKRVALPIKILGNPGVLGLTFSVSYDESAVTLVGAENGEAFGGLLTLTHSRAYASGCLFTWDGVDIKPEQVRDGTILTLYFDVSDDASGLHSVAVRGASAFDADLGDITLTTQDGSIVIE